MTGPSASRGPLLGFLDGRRAAMRMRELRVRAGLTQAQVAAMAGQADPSWVSKREQGATRLSFTEARTVAAVLGTDLPGLTGRAA